MKKSFVYGTMVLLGANLLNRCLAFLYQYLIMSWIGAEAYGIYQMVFPTYVMILVLTCAGIPLAVSKLVSEQVALGNRKNAAKIFHIALVILLGSGLVISVLVYTLVPKIAGPLFPDPRVFPVFLVCVPAIFIVAASSAFRGYFQGLQDMAPTALAQVCEQVTRVSIGIFMAVKLLSHGVEYGAVGLALGMVCGEFMGFLTLLWVYRRNRKKLLATAESTTQSFSTITKQLFGIGLPVTAGRLVASGAQAVDSFIIPLRLQAAGYTLRETTTLYGQLGGAAFTLLTFPTVFTFSLATSLVPAISEAQAQNKPAAIRHKAGEAIRYTVLIGMPFLIFIYFFGTELSTIFKSPNAGGALSTMAIAGIFLYLQSTTTGILQGLGHP
ncbi:MAG TPA: polysaccharide biosynthesis protein, partial [Verrucomicrobiae bacterium]|nr:polysaccharide biosynthesis protein [Verrucomicrobiae bacterium]